LANSTRKIFRQVEAAFDELWEDKVIPAEELEKFIIALVYIIGLDVERMQAMFDEVLKKTTIIKEAKRREKNSNVILFPTNGGSDA
jgi:soluble P-type ATPase